MTKALVVVQEKRCLIARPQLQARLAVRPVARVLTAPGKRMLVHQTGTRVLVTGRQGPRGVDGRTEIFMASPAPVAVTWPAINFEETEPGSDLFICQVQRP